MRQPVVMCVYAFLHLTKLTQFPSRSNDRSAARSRIESAPLLFNNRSRLQLLFIYKAGSSESLLFPELEDKLATAAAASAGNAIEIGVAYSPASGAEPPATFTAHFAIGDFGFPPDRFNAEIRAIVSKVMLIRICSVYLSQNQFVLVLLDPSCD